jgi:hypothetical protein
MRRVSLPEDSSFATGQQNSRPLFIAKSPLVRRIHISNEPDLVIVFPNAMALENHFSPNLAELISWLGRQSRPHLFDETANASRHRHRVFVLRRSGGGNQRRRPRSLNCNDGLRNVRRSDE